MIEMEFTTDEQETTINSFRDEDFVEVYTSDKLMITKIMKINPIDLEIITISPRTGTPTSIKAKLDKKQLLFRDIPKSKKQ